MAQNDTHKQGTIFDEWQPLDRVCAVEGCGGPRHGRGLCAYHYRRDPDVIAEKRAAEQQRMQDPARVRCIVGGCGEPLYARALCKQHWCEQPEQIAKREAYERRRKADAGMRARRQESDRRRSAQGSERRAYLTEYARRKAMPKWAEQWESRRRAEDLADLAIVPVAYGKAAQMISARPSVRQFIMGWCPDDGQPNVIVRHRWHGSIRCLQCTARRWSKDCNHKRRAWKAAAQVVETIDPAAVFERDGYRCQICKRKTRGRHPAKRSPTIDHIIPLAKGGDHSYLNVQCACFECNSTKGERAANDQLRLLA
jgi:HNH endonuclease